VAKSHSRSIHDWKEYRGVSFITGGDPDVLSIANLLAPFSHNQAQSTQSTIFGISRGSNFVRKCISVFGEDICPPNEWLYEEPEAGLNVAISGATTELLEKEADQFFKIYGGLKSKNKAVFEASWKIVTLFIGINNACQEPCDKPFARPEDSPEAYRKAIEGLISRLRYNFQRVILVLIGLPNLANYEQWILTRGQAYCQETATIKHRSCPCVTSESFRKILSERIRTYNDVLKNITLATTNPSCPPSDATCSSFKIIHWPGLQNMDFLSIKFRENLYPMDLLSPFDCYHPSQLGQEAIAVSLW
jgi:phospholipase B1, membrane-associated